jgi:hypothetical protein
MKRAAPPLRVASTMTLATSRQEITGSQDAWHQACFPAPTCLSLDSVVCKHVFMLHCRMLVGRHLLVYSRQAHQPPLT